MKVLRTRIHEYRKEQGITQDELAQRVGIRRETIGKLESGKSNPSLKLAMDVAAVLRTKVDELFYYKEVQKKEPQ